MASKQPLIGHPHREDANFILFGQSPLAPEHGGQQENQPQGPSQQQHQQPWTLSSDQEQMYKDNIVMLEASLILLFDALRKTNRTAANRREINELENMIHVRRVVQRGKDYPPTVIHWSGRIILSTEPWIYRWRDRQGNYHISPFKPPMSESAEDINYNEADNRQLVRDKVRQLDWQLHTIPRRFIPDLNWCVVCGTWHYDEEIRNVDILMLETFGDAKGLLPDDRLIGGKIATVPTIPMCVEWAQLWELGIITLVPGRTKGSWMTKVAHPDFIQVMINTYRATEGRELKLNPLWRPNPRHMYLRWAVMELLRIHNEGIKRPVVPARGVLYWENGIAEFELGHRDCDLTMIIIRVGVEIAGLEPAEIHTLFDIPPDLAQRAMDQMMQPGSKDFWEPRIHRFIHAYLGWNEVHGKTLSEYRKKMGIPFVAEGDFSVDKEQQDGEQVEEQDHEEVPQHIRQAIYDLVGTDDEEEEDAEEQNKTEDENKDSVDKEKVDQEEVIQEEVIQEEVIQEEVIQEEVDRETGEDETDEEELDDKEVDEEYNDEAEEDGEDYEEVFDDDDDEQEEFQANGYDDKESNKDGSNWDGPTDEDVWFTSNEEEEEQEDDDSWSTNESEYYQ